MAHPQRSGFSLIEVLLALTVLAVGIFTCMGTIASMAQARNLARESSTLEGILSELTERIHGCRWEALGTSQLRWSLPRHNAAAGAVNPPLTENDLLELGILSKPVGFRNLRIYFEYFRAMKRSVPGSAVQNGMMDGEGVAYSNLSALRANWGNPETRNLYRLSDASAPTGQVDEDQPVIVRIELVTDDLAKPLVIFTGRKQ
jgi:prepilin-type N-terminal cleavage/methylation domain-containing protein